MHCLIHLAYFIVYMHICGSVRPGQPRVLLLQNHPLCFWRQSLTGIWVHQTDQQSPAYLHHPSVGFVNNATLPGFSQGCWGSNSGPHDHMEALSTEQARRLSGCSMSGWSSKWVCIADTGMARSRVRASGPGEISKTSEHRFPSSGMFTAWDCSTYRDLQQRLANSSPVPYRITWMRFWVVERNRCSPSATAQAPDPSFSVYPCCLLSQVKSQ